MNLTVKHFLNEEFQAKRAVNARFSLRQFAKQLNLAPSTLSEVLSGKKGLSIQKSMEIAQILKLSTKRKKMLLDLVSIEGARNSSAKEQMILKLVNAQRLAEKKKYARDAYSALSNWHSIAMLEYSNTKDGRSIKESSAYFGVSEETALTNYMNLLKLGLVNKVGNRFIKADGRTSFEQDEKNKALTEFHCQMLRLTEKKLLASDPQQRYVGSETLKFNPSLLPTARKILDACFEDLLELSTKTKNPANEEIFYFGIQLFNTKNGGLL